MNEPGLCRSRLRDDTLGDSTIADRRYRARPRGYSKLTHPRKGWLQGGGTGVHYSRSGQLWLGSGRRKSLHPFLINIGWFHLPTYGLMLALAVTVGIYLAMRLGRRAGLDSAQILDYSTWVILVALAGAKVLMVLTRWDYYADHPVEVIFSFATLQMAGAFYGGVLAALLFTIWYVRIPSPSLLEVHGCDCSVGGLGHGRDPAGMLQRRLRLWHSHPRTVGSDFYQRLCPRQHRGPARIRLHPTQLYESVACFAIFGVLLWWFPRKQREGDIFLGYLGLYAVARFADEFLRGDEDRGFVFHHLLSTSQFIALLALAGIAGVLIWRRVEDAEKLSPVAASHGLAGARTAEAGVAAAKGRTRGAVRVSKRARR